MAINVKKCSWSIERKAPHTWTGVELVHVLNAQVNKERQEAVLANFDITYIDGFTIPIWQAFFVY